MTSLFPGVWVINWHSAVPTACDMSGSMGFDVWLVFLIEKLNVQMMVADAEGVDVSRWVRVMCPGSLSVSRSALHYPKSTPSLVLLPLLLAQPLSSEWICRCEPSFLNTMNSSSCHPYITSFNQLCSLPNYLHYCFLILKHHFICS